jgi:tetratricopeptide (TPR) repeat protein
MSLESRADENISRRAGKGKTGKSPCAHWREIYTASLTMQLSPDSQVPSGNATNFFARWTAAQRKIAISVFLFVLTVAVFFPALRNDFVNFDDPLYVTDNPQTQSGLSWAGLNWATTAIVDANWHPLTLLSHQLDCQLYGQLPWGHHLTSILLHALNTALLFVVLQRLTGATWRSFWVAALFGVHPLRVESVAWIAERKDVLSALFWILTMWVYAKFAEERARRNPAAAKFYALALSLLCLGLMSKPMLVTLPCVLLLLDYWPLRRTENEKVSRLIQEKLPFFLLSALAIVVTLSAQKSVGAMPSLAFLARVLNSIVSYSRYLAKIFYPENLCVYYPFPHQWLWSAVIGSVALLSGISLLAVVRRHQWPYLFVGWFWFLGTLVPVIGLIQVGVQAMADRYTYVPQMGLLIALVWCVHALAKRRPIRNLALPVFGIAVLLCCMILTRQQITWWRDSETLFQHAVTVTTNNYIARLNLGVALQDEGRLKEALSEYNVALAIDPTWSMAYENIGSVFTRRHRYSEASLWLEKASALDPKDATIHYRLADVLDKLGRTDEALAHYQEAVRLNPTYFDARAKLGLALSHKGLLDEAIRQLQVAAELKPDSGDVHYNLGNTFARRGQFAEAITQFQKALKLNPNDAETHNNLGVVLFTIRRPEEAVIQFQEALRLKPDYAEVKKNLAAALNAKQSAGEKRPPPPAP